MEKVPTERLKALLADARVYRERVKEYAPLKVRKHADEMVSILSELIDHREATDQ
jgi:hypothetical protein